MNNQTVKSAPDATSLHLFDDAGSKVRFLELALGEQEWQARIHLPVFLGDQTRHLVQLQRDLNARGIHCKVKRDEDRHITLEIHHPGPNPDILGMFQRYGLINGSAHVISNPVLSAKALLRGSGEIMHQTKDYLSDPARANGLIFLSAEAFLLAATGGNPYGKWHHPKNLLQGLASTLWMGQSAAYIFWAKKGDDRVVTDFSEHVDRDETQPFAELSAAPALNDRPVKGLFSKARRILEDYPIQSGALLNNAGMVAYMAHAVLERRYRKGLLKTDPNLSAARDYLERGFWSDIGGAMVSIVGWSALLATSQAPDKPADNPAESVWQFLKERPQAISSGTSLVSSSLRLRGALNKGNSLQAIGESIYLPGDVLLYFINNHEYGSSTSDNLDPLVDKIANVIIRMPMVASPQRQTDLIEETANYLLRQHLALRKSQNLEDTQQQKEEKHAAITERLAQGCSGLLNERYDRMVGAARRTIGLFPPEKQLDVAQALADTLPKLTGLHARPEELATALCHRGLPQPRIAKGPVRASELANGIGEIVFSIPGEHAGQNAAILYDALKPLSPALAATSSKALETSLLSQAEAQLEQARNFQSAIKASPEMRAQAL